MRGAAGTHTFGNFSVNLFEFEGYRVYRVYRTNPGDDLTGNILDRATLVAQYDRPSNRTGFNNGFDEVRLPEPITFDGGGEHSWDLLSDSGLNPATGLYLFTVKNLETGEIQKGKFVIIK